MTFEHMPPPGVPELSDDWVATRREHLVNELTRSVHRRRVRRGAFTGAVGVAASIIAIILVVAGPGTTNAFAGWTATPTPPTHEQLSAAESSCHAAAAHLPQKLPEVVLSDARGPFTTIVYADTMVGASVLCTTGPNLQEISGCQNTFPPGSPETVPPKNLSFRTEVSDTNYTLIAGLAGSDVKMASVLLDDGKVVQTTIANGWFEAWWPGRSAVRSVQIWTSSGIANESLGIPDPKFGGPTGGHNFGMCVVGTSSRS